MAPRHMLMKKVMSTSHAARIVGKVDYAASTLFSKVGRASLEPIRVRQRQVVGLQRHMIQSLRWPIDPLWEGPPRIRGVYPGMGAPIV